jgi:two-component system chemotaxis response regulator CheB
MLATILTSDKEIEVVGQAKDGLEAVEMVERLRPDLVTMDIHMPKMDGLAATEKIMAFTPTPILVVSSSVYGEGMGRAFDALNLGALEVIKKPEARDWNELDRIGREVIKRVKILAKVKVITHIRGRHKRGVDVVDMPVTGVTQRSIVAIGSSTGGPSALLDVLGRLPKDLPVPVVVAQHIADGFIPGLVSWLDAGCQIKIVAAEDGQEIEPGVAYFAPTCENMVVDGRTLRFQKPSHGQLYIPSADSLFFSVARSYGKRSIGVILTGMGGDGTDGLKALRDRGAVTIGQDEATCVVYGMPKMAADAGAVQESLPVQHIAEAIEKAIAG